jgi:hypothetical protein
VNGDGFGDVIVGAPRFDNGQPNEGRAFVYLGSAAGLVATPAWTAESDHDQSAFGWAVGTAGDVNGDGFSDVIIGAVGYENGQAYEGRAFAYYGSAAGLAMSPNWTAEGDWDFAGFGRSVASAGDVNGDGFSDVIVGGEGYDNGEFDEGRAFAYHGSAAGLSTTPAWTAESNQANSGFAGAVATAGDVNGDGFSDVIVGAPRFSPAGRAYVYQGSVGGLGNSPAWTKDGSQSGEEFGGSAAAGDVNNDGFADVIVGSIYYNGDQFDEGRLSLFYGSVAGLSTTAGWFAEQNQAFSGFGWSVSAAGDVGGDGFPDIVVGAPTSTNPGRAFLYYGNNAEGIDRNPRQVRTGDSRQIGPLGISDSPTGFRLSARGRTAVGRGRVQLQFEVKPLGVPFDGTDLVTGPVFDTGAPVDNLGSVVALTELATDLTPDTPYCWRMRVRAKSPFIPHTPWLTLPYNNLTETDLRTALASAGISNAEAPAAERVMLDPVRPNPLHSQAEIAYTLREAGRVRVTVVDVSGRVRAVLVYGSQAAGRHAVRWEGRDGAGAKLPRGVYLVRLEANGEVSSRKLVIEH